MSDRFDYVVVGAGTAGCLVANRLSADPRRRVLLLEAGGADDYIWIRIPVGYLYCIGNPRTDWMISTVAEPGLNGRSIKYPRGKVLGGCSSINGMIYMRGQAADYDGWAQRGCTGWSWNEVIPYFIRHEDYHKLDGGAVDPLHGHGGEWRVENQRLSWAVLDAWRDAAAQIGIAPIDDFNRGDNFGCGYFEVNQRRGVRWNASRAFLAPVRDRPNLTIWTGAHVTRLVFDQGDNGRPRVSGLDVQFNTTAGRVGGAGQRTVLIDREVVLAAGAIGTPQLLELSGVGQASRLQALGIKVVADLPGVGENLQDHLQLRMIYRLSNAVTLNEQANSWIGKAKMGLQYVLTKRGPMTMSPSQLGAFAKSGPEHARANIEYHVQPLSLDKFGEPLHRFPAMTASVCNLRPESRGTVHVCSPSAFEMPLVAPNYLSAPADRSVAAQSIRVTRRIMKAPAMQPYLPEELLPGAAMESDEQLAERAGAIGTTIFHPVGTCKMGPESDPSSVVDPMLRLRGVDGVRVCDASVMPHITSGNTNAPTLMIAERASEWIIRS